MSYINKLNKKLSSRFDGKVEAREEGGILILSGELQLWQDVVLAGKMSVNNRIYDSMVNDIVCTGDKPTLPRKPAVRDNALQGMVPDVLIIGGGVIGCSIARELSRYKLDVLLVEKEHDLAMQASGRCDGMVHSGADVEKGTLKYFYSRRGNKMFGDVCAELGVDFDRCGQYVCYRNRVWEAFWLLPLLYWKWRGMKGVKYFGKHKLQRMGTADESVAGAALFFPSAGVVCPYTLTLAYAENAVQNGAQVFLNTFVREMEMDEGLIRSVTTNRGTIYPKCVVNAAGVFCEDIAQMAGDRFFSIHPRKVLNAVLDKKFGGEVVRTVISSLSGTSKRKNRSKGGRIMRTIGGNIIVGSDDMETIEREDFTTIQQNVSVTFRRHEKITPDLSEQQIIACYSGIRASTYDEDFIVRKGRYTRNIVHAAGIQSPGLTAAPAISADVAKMVVELFGGEAAIERNPDFNPVREPLPRTAAMSIEERAALIAENPDYGVIVCRCEEVSKGEILDAMRRGIPCSTIDGVKRRVRPGMGRCQGGFCGPLVLDIIAKEKGLSPRQVRKSDFGSELLLCSTKEVSKDGI